MDLLPMRRHESESNRMSILLSQQVRGMRNLLRTPKYQGREQERDMGVGQDSK